MKPEHRSGSGQTQPGEGLVKHKLSFQGRVIVEKFRVMGLAEYSSSCGLAAKPQRTFSSDECWWKRPEMITRSVFGNSAFLLAQPLMAGL